MKTYQYTSPEQTVVAVFDEDGISRMSMLTTALPEGTSIQPYVPKPVPLPSAVTMRQARLALLGAGLLPSVDAAIASMPSPQREAAKIEWEYSQEVQRHNGFVSVLGPMLGLTGAQIDALFIGAAAL